MYVCLHMNIVEPYWFINLSKGYDRQVDLSLPIYLLSYPKCEFEETTRK